MVKLTAELIQMSAQFINPVRDRQLDLRGYKIGVIENLGATLDQFDCIDLSDNDIRKLDGFPQLKRIKCLLLNNNRVCRIGENLQECLPQLDTLVLTNNHIQELGDIDPLSTIETLTTLSLMKNPVASKRYYRYYVIHKLPQLRLLDFRKIRMKEKEESAKLFKGKRGKQLEKEIGKRSKTFVPGANLPSTSTAEKSTGPTAADVEAIRDAIKNATTLEEVERLKQMLKSGQIPKKDAGSSRTDEEMETDSADVNGK
ncbi:U2 small nuclear ribonucleoprotein A'-like [Uloborus diversus]|uniref:U2 small nuclear ribonucleoprotein A'-like n=1 Tax=Uloborus diversus TaxID=327109 RepID=UPI002409DF17|nr:U2 small nuclear ribonucleoprotein A'-like [Uloborus diversus]XP_054716281.1 U2 small nuclear ribonucleoprotein A'-like [Uloborus diversus]